MSIITQKINHVNGARQLRLPAIAVLLGLLLWPWYGVEAREPETTDAMPRIATWIGRVTHYGPYYTNGMLMRDETPYDPDAATCAVDNALWPELKHKWLLVTRLSDGVNVTCMVRDTGYFQGWNVVVDLPDGLMRNTFGLGAWMVSIRIIPPP